jgi:chorismate mutase
MMIAHRTTARPGTRERFEQPKVLVRDTGGGLEGTFDGDCFYAKDVLIITDREQDKQNLKALTGILNSKLMRFYYETSFPTLHVQRDELASLPIHAFNLDLGEDRARRRELVALVEKMLKLHKDVAKAKSQATKDTTQSEIKETDQQIDTLVYELYGLTEEEIRIAEGGGS